MNDINTMTINGLRAYTEEDKKDWADETTDGGPLVWHHPKLGWIAIGPTPMGYDQPMLRLTPGVPVLGYQFRDGELYLLALFARRFNVDKKARLPEVSGGFVGVNTETGSVELPKSGALRELVEETGLDLNDVILADGNPFIADRALFWKQEGDGNTVFFFELGAGQLAHVELQDNLEMLHWTQFIEQTADGITLSAIARVMAHLNKMKKLKVVQA